MTVVEAFACTADWLGESTALSRRPRLKESPVPQLECEEANGHDVDQAVAAILCSPDAVFQAHWAKPRQAYSHRKQCQPVGVGSGRRCSAKHV
jgi:hypothetical protein